MCKYLEIKSMWFIWEREKFNMVKVWNVNIGVIRYEVRKVSRKIWKFFYERI